MKKVLLAVLVLAIMCFSGCNGKDLPNEPGSPGLLSGGDIAGMAYTGGYDKYAPPFDVFNNNQPLYSLGNIEYFEDKFDLPLAVNHAGAYIYNIGYVWIVDHWVPFTFDEQTYRGSKWIKDTASHTLELNFAGFNPEENYIVSYSCKKINGVWKCGCASADDSCNKWMLRTFQIDANEFPPPPGEVPDSICGNARCESDENEDSCPRDCSITCGNGVCDAGEDQLICEQCAPTSEWKVATDTKTLALGEKIGVVKESISNPELAILPSGDITNGLGTATYNQYLKFPAENSGSIQFLKETDDRVNGATDTEDYFMYFPARTTIANYELEFTRNFVSNIVSQHAVDFEGKTINILGKEYTIDIALISGNNEGLQLVLSGESDIILLDNIISDSTSSSKLTINAAPIDDNIDADVTIEGNVQENTVQINKIKINFTTDDDLYVPANDDISSYLDNKDALMRSFDLAFKGLDEQQMPQVYVTGYCEQCQVKCPEDCGLATCTDSDGGKDYYVKGTVSASNLPGIVKGDSLADAIFDTSAVYDDCSGMTLDNGLLSEMTEFYCENGVAKREIHGCPNGCSDGACIAAPQPSYCMQMSGAIGDCVTCANAGDFTNCPGAVIGPFETGLAGSETCINDATNCNLCYLTSDMANYQDVTYCPNGCSDGACI